MMSFLSRWRFWRKSPVITPINVMEAAATETHHTQEAKERAIDALRKLGYAFNGAGVMCKVDQNTDKLTDQPFAFHVHANPDMNESHYQEVAALIPDIVYDLLEKEGLVRIYVPPNIPLEQATFFFVAPVPFQRPQKLLVLIHGSGFVKAGQWARSLIISNSVDHGSQLPYIRRAQSLGYAILVMNTNDTWREINGKRTPIPGLGTAMQHAEFVWRNCVIPSEPTSVAIVAHSFGGAITLHLVARFTKFFRERVFALAFTDSVHGRVPKNMQMWVQENTCNYVRSKMPAGSHMSSIEDGVTRVSAGHNAHEWTSYAAIDEVFEFMEKRYKYFTKCRQPEDYGKKRRRSSDD